MASITRGGITQSLEQLSSIELDDKKIKFYESHCYRLLKTRPVAGSYAESRHKAFSYEAKPCCIFVYASTEEAKAAFDKINKLIGAVNV